MLERVNALLLGARAKHEVEVAKNDSSKPNQTNQS